MKYRPRIYYTEEQKTLIWDLGRKETPYTRLPNCLTDTIHQSAVSLLSQVAYTQSPSPTIKSIAHIGRTRRDLTWISELPFPAGDCSTVRLFSVDHQPGSLSQWQSDTLPGQSGRSGNPGIVRA